MTTKKLPEDDLPPYLSDPEGDGKKDDDKKKDKKEKSTYDVDPTDPNYVEPRLRPDWTPDQPG
jgi:hypothetical protein